MTERRPIKFNADIQDELLRLIRAGNDRGEAAKRCRIAERTFKYWMAHGRTNLAEVAEANEREAGAGDPLLSEFGMFALEVLAAEAAVEASLKEVVMRAALGSPGTPATKDRPATPAVPGNYKAALEVLERRWPMRWSKRVRAVKAYLEEDEDQGAPGGPSGNEPIAAGLTSEAAASIEESFLGIPRSKNT